MKIAFISSEVTPFSKTGGLADVAGSLPKELHSLGNDVIVFTPKYSIIDETKFDLKEDKSIGNIPVAILDKTYIAKIFRSKLPGSTVTIFFVDCPHFFARDLLYTEDPDEDERFIFFSQVVIEILRRLNWSPNIIHCNDWHTGLIPALIKENYRYDKTFLNTAFIYTVHNIAFQGIFKKVVLQKSGLNENLYFPLSPFEFYGKVNFLKAGILYADIINTVSESYAKEILTPEFGAGLEDILAERKEDLYGIVNGIDYDDWNPETDKLIPHNFSTEDLTGKEKNKKALLKHFGLHYNKAVPLIGFIARLTNQKGFDIILEAFDELMELNAQWVFLGSGEAKYEKFLEEKIKKKSGNFSAHIGFDNDLAHLIEAGSDLFLMPSRFEPCGLNQIYSLKYGTIPIVRKTGGLADTVSDWFDFSSKGNQSGTGFVFDNYSSMDLLATIKKAVELFPDKEVWRQIQKNGMLMDYSWKTSAEKYIRLYNKALGKW